jgi:hypothetical protein
LPSAESRENGPANLARQPDRVASLHRTDDRALICIVNIPATTGPQISGLAKFVFGWRGPVEEIDDLRAWR